MTVFLWALAIILGLLAAWAWWMSRTTYGQVSWDIRLDSAPALDEAKVKGPPVTLCLVGNLPKKMHADGSRLIVLGGDIIQQPDVSFAVPRGIDVQIQLLAAAFDVDGERLQRKHMPQIGSNVSFRWSVMPKKTGMQELALVASWLDDDGRAYDIDAKTHAIKVVRFLGLTARKARWFSVGATILALLLAAASALADWLSLLDP